MNVEACDKCKSLSTNLRLFYITRTERKADGLVEYLGFDVSTRVPGTFGGLDPLYYHTDIAHTTTQLCQLCLAERVNKYTKEWQGL